MSRVDPAFAYSQARLQARYGARPTSATWSLVAATADLGALLQVLRGSPVGRWTSRLGNRPGVHEIERRLRDEWRRDVAEIAAWQPESWREGIRWMQWIAYLPALQKLARGGRAPEWARDDPVLGPIVARAPADRATALRHSELAPIAEGFSPPHDTLGAWVRHWRALWPVRAAGRRPLDGIVNDVGRLGGQLSGLPADSRTNDALRPFERRLELRFRRNPLTPIATIAYLGLLALDLRRVRGALATRALREGTVAP